MQNMRKAANIQAVTYMSHGLIDEHAYADVSLWSFRYKRNHMTLGLSTYIPIHLYLWVSQYHMDGMDIVAESFHLYYTHQRCYLLLHNLL